MGLQECLTVRGLYFPNNRENRLQQPQPDKLRLLRYLLVFCVISGYRAYRGVRVYGKMSAAVYCVDFTFGPDPNVLAVYRGGVYASEIDISCLN